MDTWVEVERGLGPGLVASLNMEGAGVEGSQMKLEDRQVGWRCPLDDGHKDF